MAAGTHACCTPRVCTLHVSSGMSLSYVESSEAGVPTVSATCRPGVAGRSDDGPIICPVLRPRRRVGLASPHTSG